MDLTILNFLKDIDFVLKIFFFLFIISFVRRRITHNVFSLILISLATIVLIVFYWPIFGTMFFVYTLLTIGVTHVLVDFFFVSMDKSAEEMVGGNQPQGGDDLHSGKEIMEKQQNIKNAQRFKPFR
jgi:hypothetical protein